MTDWGPFDLAGRSAVVTGGAMGIGQGIVTRFVEAGGNVAVAELDGEAAATVAKATTRRGQTIPLPEGPLAQRDPGLVRDQTVR